MRRGSLPGLLLALLLAASAQAAPDGRGDWRKQQKALDKLEDAYWDGFRDRLTAVYTDWRGKQSLWWSDPEAYKDEVLPLDGLRALYEDYAEIVADRIARDRDLASSGDAGAVEELFDALLETAKAIDALEKEIAEERPTSGGSRYDQEPSVRRHGLQRRLDGLVAALAEVPVASAFLLTEGWTKAEKNDKRRSLVRRVAVLDALGRIGDEASQVALRQRLSDPQPFARITALEHVVGRGAEAIDALAPLLADPAPAVRRALLGSIAARASAVPDWIPPLVERLEAAQGLERELVLRALEVLAGESLGSGTDAWRAWLGVHAQEIRQGTFQRAKPPEGGPSSGSEASEPGRLVGPGLRVPAATTFYGLPAPSTRLLFVVPGGSDTAVPADLEVQRKFSKGYWRYNGPKWRDIQIDHRGLLLQQLELTLSALSEDACFGLVDLVGSTPSRVEVFGEKQLLRPTRSSIRSVLKKVERPTPDGQMSVEEGLRRVLDLCGCDPFEDPKADECSAEVVYVVDPGWNGGRWPLPEVLVEAFLRENRFRRLALYTIRLLDEKAEAERLMQGLAAATGGDALWLTRLP